MSDVRSCGQCGVTLPDDSPHGVCPSCLMRLGMGAQDASHTQPHQAGRQSFVPPKPHELAVHFPQLEILDLIGQGGMGAVYKARQVRLDRIVALKILPPHAGDDGSFAGRFEREARSLARLNHPNIVTVFDSGHVGDYYYFVMEFVDGVNLRDAIRGGRLAPAEALAIVPQICDALQYAHDEGIVHRDIKPENVLIDKKGNTRIADFGLARLLGPTTDVTLTGTHQVMGTPRYMSPEQMEGAHDVDHRADIYSLGVVFYEMLTGELPMGRFDGPSKKVQIDVRLDEVVFRTLEKEPARRYQHASEIKTDLQAISASRGGVDHGGGSPRFSRVGHASHYEYKSETHVFGWPLVHIAYGTDPTTGKPAHAKGIIALGNIAQGVVAIGTFAVGGIAIGAGAVGGLAIGGGAVGALTLAGASLGLFSFGGIAIGLLVAAGGVAFGLGLSYGGLAVGAVAQGGLAIGWYADAGHGVAYGAHAIGSNVPNPDMPAVSVFGYLATMGARSVFIGILMMASATLLSGTLVSIRTLRRKKVWPPREVPPKAVPTHRGFDQRAFDQPPHRSHWGIMFVVLLVGMFAAMCVVVILGLGFSYDSLEVATPEVTVISDSISEARHGNLATETELFSENAAAVEAIDWIVWTEDGPTLDPRFGVAGKQLSRQQRNSLNQVLREGHTEYVQLERQNIKQARNASGHWVSTVVFEDNRELTELENQLWTKIDAIVDVDWQKLMRGNLNFQSPGDIGVLGFEDHRGRIEIWQVGSWYHWQLTTKSARPEMGMSSMSMGGSGMDGGDDAMSYEYGSGRGFSLGGGYGDGGVGLGDGGAGLGEGGVGRGDGGGGAGLGEGGAGLGDGSETAAIDLGVRGPEHAAPQLPIRYRRFWNKPRAE